MFDWEKILAPGILIVAWVGSFEWRLRNKVGQKHFDDTLNLMKGQQDRMESHLWDLLRAQKIEPSADLPEKIKNNSKGKK